MAIRKTNVIVSPKVLELLGEELVEEFASISFTMMAEDNSDGRLKQQTFVNYATYDSTGDIIACRISDETTHILVLVGMKEEFVETITV
jgi:hypothetical protein